MRIISIDSKDTAAVKKLNPTDEGLSCLEAISFDYVVKWPLSLIISRKQLVPYQLLFRFLFYTKYIEWILNNTWRYASELTKRFRVADDKSHAAFILRHRMLVFVQHLQSYITFGVIEPQWKVFMETLAKVQNVDEVLNAHSRFLENCLRSGQLSTKDIFRIIHKILLVVSQFVNFLNQTFAQVEQLSALIGTTDFDENMERLFGEHFQEQVRLHDKSFSDKIKRLIVELENIQTKETSDSIMNLLLKLDYNRYYGHFPATRA